MTDVGLLLVAGICLFSTGHWIGGSVCVILVLLADA